MPGRGGYRPQANRELSASPRFDAGTVVIQPDRVRHRRARRGYRPVHFGGRFSTNARTPSRKSALA
jgi:hypothetical protein